MTLRIYHNPRCSKSRETLTLLRDAGQEPEVVEYLKTPPGAPAEYAVQETRACAARAGSF